MPGLTPQKNEQSDQEVSEQRQPGRLCFLGGGFTREGGLTVGPRSPVLWQDVGKGSPLIRHIQVSPSQDEIRLARLPIATASHSPSGRHTSSSCQSCLRHAHDQLQGCAEKLTRNLRPTSAGWEWLSADALGKLPEEGQERGGVDSAVPGGMLAPPTDLDGEVAKSTCERSGLISQRAGQQRPMEGVTEDGSGLPYVEGTYVEGHWSPLDV